MPGLRGRPLLLHGRRPQPGDVRQRERAPEPRGRHQVGGRPVGPDYSDCGATVLANYKQVKISAPPNLNEPIGFDQLPDGRIIQTARAGQVRLHDPEGGTTTVLANLGHVPAGPVHAQRGRPLRPGRGRQLRAEQVGVPLLLAGGREGRPAVGRHDADVPDPDGVAGEPDQHPACQAPVVCPITAPLTAASTAAWDPYVGYFQLSRFKFVEAAPGNPAHLDPASEQEIMRVPVNRGACCHVGGDIDFDKAGNLWLVTGDDTPSGGGNSGGFSPFNDMKTNEIQTVRVTNATGGTFTLTFAGQTTAPIAFNATAAQLAGRAGGAEQRRARRRRRDSAAAVACQRHASTRATRRSTFRGQYTQDNVPEMTTDASGLHGHHPDGHPIATTQEGDFFQAPVVDARRSAMNTNDLRGKVLRIKVNDERLVHDPGRQPVRARHGRDASRRSTPWASGTRSGSRSTPRASRTSPTTRRTRRSRRPSAGRRARAAWRSCASRPTTRGRCA